MARGGVPMNFYFARMEAMLPYPWILGPTYNVAYLVWRMDFFASDSEMMQENNNEIARMVLHFQPRFQIAPVTVDLVMRHGQQSIMEIEFDGRLVHP
mmetsp:Transcript_17473/g.22248  ORF Transcript_17473/g.22248 Transcript_17473/m.22248 type:complete len:97 (+) Transcript_17473:3-293(+)